MAATVKLVFRRDKLNDEGIAPVYIRLIKDRKVNYIATGIKMHERFWDAKANKVKSNYPNSAWTNNLLNKMLYEYEDGALKAQV